MPVHKQLLPTITTGRKSRWNISDGDIKKFASSLRTSIRTNQVDNSKGSSSNRSNNVVVVGGGDGGGSDNNYAKKSRILDGEKFVSISKEDDIDVDEVVDVDQGELLDRLRRYSL